VTVRKGTIVHPAAFDIVLKLKDGWGFTYEDLSHLLGVTPSRVQQIVLHQRRKGQTDANHRTSGEQTKEWGSVTA
jgi:alkylated DNA nucleotide flippase Atl1